MNGNGITNPLLGGLNQHSGVAFFEQLVPAFVTLALVGGAIVFFFMLVIGGIRWILSGGDKGQTEAARNQITAALVGLVIVFAAWAIAQLIGSLFGIQIFTSGFQIPTFTGK